MRLWALTSFHPKAAAQQNEAGVLVALAGTPAQFFGFWPKSVET
jgi:hypothetical protein